MARKSADVNAQLKHVLKARLDLTLDENALCSNITDSYFSYVTQKDAALKKKKLDDFLKFLLDTKFISEETRNASISEDEKLRSVATQRWTRSVIYLLRDYCQDRHVSSVTGNVTSQEWESKWTKVAKGSEDRAVSQNRPHPQSNTGEEIGSLGHHRKRPAHSDLNMNVDQKPSMLSALSQNNQSDDEMQVGEEASVDFSARNHPELYRSTFVDSLNETKLRLETLSLRLTCMRQCREEGVVCPDFVTSGMRFKKRTAEGSKDN